MTEIAIENLEETVIPDNSIIRHIHKHNLPLKFTKEISAPDGNCFWNSLCILIKHHRIKLRNGVPAPSNPADLRKAVVLTIATHGNVKEWILGPFKRSKKNFNAFVKNQFLSGTFTDAEGIVVTCAAQYLNVLFNIVSTSHESNVPYFTMPDDDRGPEEERLTL